MITRRTVLQATAAGLGAMATFGSYAFAIEPLLRLAVTRYRIAPKSWPKGLSLKIAVLADIHACEPWMSADRVADIAAAANALEPDIVLLLGDYISTHRFVKKNVPHAAWTEAVATCRAPLGVHAILGNHDWWDDWRAQEQRRGPVEARRALEARGIPVYENRAVRLVKGGQPFWLAGLGDQLALLDRRSRARHLVVGVDDLPGTLAQVTDDAPVVLMAHEPDVFPRVPERVALTLSGHTHGGQVRLLGYSPVVPSRYRNRYAYGHVVEDGRHLVVSGGLGCSLVPVRLGVPPEIVLIELGADEAVS